MSRKGLFVLTVSAEEYGRPREFPWYGTPGRAVNPARICVKGKTPDSQGHVYLVLSDNAQEDVTVTVKGAKHYSANVWPAKHKLIIKANDIELEPDEIVPNAEFCVGQKIVFSLSLSPALPDGALRTNQCKYKWYLPPKFVNGYEQYLGYGAYYYFTCEPCSCGWSRFAWLDIPDAPYCKRYDIYNWPLTQPQTGAWWISGGPKIASSYLDLTFNNGQKASLIARGQFNMLKPDVTRVVPHGPFAADIDRSGILPSLRLMNGPMAFTVYISETYPGKFGITQLIKMFSQTMIPLPPFFIWHSTEGAFWLDGKHEFYDGETRVDLNAWPSDDEYPHGSEIWDAPGRTLFWAMGSYEGYWKAYVRFTPAGGGSIPVTLARIDWDWAATALWLSALNLWAVTSDGVNPPKEHPDDSFPEWTRVRPAPKDSP